MLATALGETIVEVKPDGVAQEVEEIAAESGIEPEDWMEVLNILQDFQAGE